MLLSFDSADPKHAECMEKLREVDRAILGKVQESGWASRAELEWHPCLKEKDGKYFNIKFKLPRIGEDQAFLTTIIDGVTGQETTLEEGLTAGCLVQVMGRPARVYVRKGQVGVIWEATMIRTRPDPAHKQAVFLD